MKTKTIIPDGIYFVFPYGGAWEAAMFRAGKLRRTTEASNADTHAAAGDVWAGVVPSESDDEVDDDVQVAVVKAVMPGCDPRMVAVTRMGDD